MHPMFTQAVLCSVHTAHGPPPACGTDRPQHRGQPRSERQVSEPPGGCCQSPQAGLHRRRDVPLFPPFLSGRISRTFQTFSHFSIAVISLLSSRAPPPSSSSRCPPPPHPGGMPLSLTDRLSDLQDSTSVCTLWGTTRPPPSPLGSLDVATTLHQDS